PNSWRNSWRFQPYSSARNSSDKGNLQGKVGIFKDTGGGQMGIMPIKPIPTIPILTGMVLSLCFKHLGLSSCLTRLMNLIRLTEFWDDFPPLPESRPDSSLKKVYRKRVAMADRRLSATSGRG